MPRESDKTPRSAPSGRGASCEARRVCPRFYSRILRAAALVLLCCSCATKPASGATFLTFRGVVEAYGSEPHLVFMIRAADGRLFYPAGELQKAVSALRDAEYEWTGELLPPRPSLPGLIPAHDGSFTDLTWR